MSFRNSDFWNDLRVPAAPHTACGSERAIYREERRFRCHFRNVGGGALRGAGSLLGRPAILNGACHPGCFRWMAAPKSACRSARANRCECHLTGNCTCRMRKVISLAGEGRVVCKIRLAKGERSVSHLRRYVFALAQLLPACAFYARAHDAPLPLSPTFPFASCGSGKRQLQGLRTVQLCSPLAQELARRTALWHDVLP
ncbi:MAG: hypothetical protein AW10_01325 [Candidatus Accumulibacter appositus]|uniref:Uncharacterized protein n=1 Tax=Candidatus Accumulibacter appositus TaxID=1454003 RepID=A0A011PWA6_9PROT|nr:MAG: hypothetical protein AW10_01325 [Candidatus Accumulibacter appositus]